MVGPFIFFDHMGPADFAPGQGIQVRPHPHIGIATITYLFEGNGTMAVARRGESIDITARSACRLMLFGGAPVGHREIWWNFVAPTGERIERAKQDWKAGRFPMIEGDDEFIPLPD